MHVTTIPQRVFTNRLLTGERELFCYISIPQEEIASDPPAKVAWRLSSGSDALSGTFAVTERQLTTGRIPVQILLPTHWQDGQLDIDVCCAHNVWHTSQPITQFSQQTTFQLPLAGLVLILGGHRIGEVHRAAWQIPSQQFGWDLLPLGTDGKMLLTDFSEQLKPQDFVGFGWSIVSPAKGRIVQATEGQPDLPNVGTHPDPKLFLDDLRRALGNSVIIDHGDGIWSCCAHLREGSVKVSKGMDIEAGQIIGELGNSGFTSGPHLHIHFMDSPDPLTASPLPVELDVEGSRYAPQAGEILSN